MGYGCSADGAPDLDRRFARRFSFSTAVDSPNSQRIEGGRGATPRAGLHCDRARAAEHKRRGHRFKSKVTLSVNPILTWFIPSGGVRKYGFYYLKSQSP